MIREEVLSDGVALLADVTDPKTILRVKDILGGDKPELILADPEYGDIVDEHWDKSENVTGLKPGSKEAEQTFVDWMIQWTLAWAELLPDGGPMYVWGGVGKPSFRPFLAYMSQIERASAGALTLSPITWKKKRAYGIQHNYLFCREELAYLCKGDVKKPHRFNIPLLGELRGYDGYNEKYKAKSEFKRRSNVWVDVDACTDEELIADFIAFQQARRSDIWDETELLRGKRHTCHKVKRVNEIPIEVHTDLGKVVIDLFAGSMSASEAARKLGRMWIAIENDPVEFEKSVKFLRGAGA